MKPGKKCQVIMRLIDAVNEKDKERVQSFFSSSSRFQTLRGGAVVGQDEIWETLTASRSGAEGVDWEFDQLDEDESGKVVTVGKVRYLKNGSWREYPVRGAFEVRGSKITQWV